MSGNGSDGGRAAALAIAVAAVALAVVLAVMFVVLGVGDGDDGGDATIGAPVADGTSATDATGDDSADGGMRVVGGDEGPDELDLGPVLPDGQDAVFGEDGFDVAAAAGFVASMLGDYEYTLDGYASMEADAAALGITLDMPMDDTNPWVRYDPSSQPSPSSKAQSVTVMASTVGSRTWRGNGDGTYDVVLDVLVATTETDGVGASDVTGAWRDVRSYLERTDEWWRFQRTVTVGLEVSGGSATLRFDDMEWWRSSVGDQPVAGQTSG